MLNRLDQLAEQAGRVHADRVAAMLDGFPPAMWQEVLNAGAETLGAAVDKFAAILRETTPEGEVAEICQLVRLGYSTQLGLWLTPAQGRA